MIRKSLSIAGAARRLGVAAICMVLLGASVASADSLNGRPTIVDLIQGADLIIHGDVVEVTDGIENGLPYTQVKVRVRESLRGNVSGEYTFRQFGLLAPRKMGNGLVNMNVTPVDWSVYKTNEEVMLFLWPEARKSGLRTTVGLKHGKFVVKAGNLVNGDGNLGLFEDIQVDQKLLNDTDSRVLANTRGPVNAAAFKALVRRAVNDQWIEKGKMRHATL